MNEKQSEKKRRDIIFTKSVNRIIDMDIEPGIKRIEIDCNVHMKHTKKSFPDVEELMVGPNIDEICIPNTLFPNIQMVYSDSIFFSCRKISSQKKQRKADSAERFLQRYKIGMAKYWIPWIPWGLFFGEQQH